MWRASGSRRRTAGAFRSPIPFDGAPIVDVPDLGLEAARRAIDTAHAVQKDWAKRTGQGAQPHPARPGTT